MNTKQQRYEEEYELDNIYNCDTDERYAYGAEPSIWYNPETRSDMNKGNKLLCKDWVII